MHFKSQKEIEKQETYWCAVLWQIIRNEIFQEYLVNNILHGWWVLNFTDLKVSLFIH